MKITIIALGLAFFINLAFANSGTYDMAVNDGCESGKNTAGQSWHQFKKDTDRYINDQYYKTGWDDGFAKCKSETDSTNAAIDDAINKSFR